MENKVYGLLGLAMKAGRLLSGSEQVEKGLRDKKGSLLLIASDSSDRTKKQYVNAAKHAGITCRFFGKKEILGQVLGKNVRTAVLITDKGFARAILKKLEPAHENGGSL